MEPLATASWERVEALFDEALDRPPEERRQVLDSPALDPETRQRLGRLLHFAQVEISILDQPIEERAAALLQTITSSQADDESSSDASWVGRRIGPYEILDSLGRGGMGAVFRARRIDGEVDQEVAVKLAPAVLFDRELESRFRSERQILAGLRHPHIARFLDVGATREGIPYLVAELVDGVPIDRYCEGRELGLAERLELFLQVTAAVEYLHRNLVVHRDLKPSNILVTEAGEVRLLDFGIAKILADDPDPGITRLGRQPLTPECASPEQLRGEAVTTASDVYSLGVLLYTLLAGRPPIELDGSSWPTMLQRVSEQEPPPPSRAGQGTPRGLNSDLDAITLKALQKRPEDRYGSAADLAADLRRYLEGRPVAAKAPTAGYRARKWIRRHRLAAVAAAIAAFLLSAAVVAVVWQRNVAQSERDQARLAATKAERTAELLQSVFQDADPWGDRGTELSARQLLLNGVDRVRKADETPEVRAALLSSLARSLDGLGEAEQALELHREALELGTRAYGELHREVGRMYFEEGKTLFGLSRRDEAIAAYREAVRVLRQTDPRSIDLAQGLNHLASAEGSDPRGEPQLLEALEIARVAGDRGVEAAVLAHLSTYYSLIGRDQEALDIGRQAIAVQREASGPVHPNLASMLGNQALKLYGLGELDEAEDLYRQALDVWERATNPQSTALINPLTSYGRLLTDAGRFSEAQPVVERARAIAQQYDELHYSRLAAETNFASLEAARGSLDAAITAYRSILERMIRSVGDDHLASHRIRALLGKALVRSSRFEEARPLLEAALGAQEGEEESTVPRNTLADTRLGLGILLRESGDSARAEPLLRQAVEDREATLPAGNWRIHEARLELADCLLRRQRKQAAAALLVSSAPALATVLGRDDERSRRAAALLEGASEKTRKSETIS